VSSNVQRSPSTPPVAPSKSHRPRVPLAVGDIQVNHCRMPSCVNFGVPARTSGVKTGRAKGQSAPRSLPNATVASCRNTNCVNHGQAVASSPGAYSRYGKTSSGTQRYGCKACKGTFSVAQAGPPQPTAAPPPEDRYRILRCSAAAAESKCRSNRTLALPKSSSACRHPSFATRRAKVAHPARKQIARAMGKAWWKTATSITGMA
jgi:hypothetical protein